MLGDVEAELEKARKKKPDFGVSRATRNALVGIWSPYYNNTHPEAISVFVQSIINLLFYATRREGRKKTPPESFRFIR